jgi:hypothetical protein
MPREIFVVARDRPDLYHYLTETFADAENVSVVWDRRSEERRNNGGPEGEKRRESDRRTRPDIEADLRSVGYAFLSVD